MLQTLIDYISRFITIEEEEIKLIESLFQAKSYPKGSYFLQEGAVSKEVGFLIEGLVTYCIEGDDLHLYNFGVENNFVCNYESFLTKTPSSKSIKCVEKTVMLCISYENLQVLYNRVSEGQKMGRLISEELFLQATVDITSFYVDTPEQRYQKFLAEHPLLNQRLPQYLIASYLKIKPQSLSRIRHRMFKNDFLT